MPETIREKLAAWIDIGVIAEHILDELEDQASSATHENAKFIWLDVVEHDICDTIRDAITTIIPLG